MQKEKEEATVIKLQKEEADNKLQKEEAAAVYKLQCDCK